MEFIADERGERLDRFLASRAKARSRSEWERAIRRGAVAVNGRVQRKPAHALRAHDRIVVLEALLPKRAEEFVPDAEPELPLAVVYEDRDLVVVNKPAGLLTHPTPQEPRHTLVNALVARYPEIVGVGENPFRPGIVHRLDKDTSGLLVVARNQDAFQFMKRQFLDHKVEKRYLALVEGVPRTEQGTIKFSIRPSTKNRLKKVAITRTHADSVSWRTRTNAEKAWTHADNEKSIRAAETSYRVVKEIRGAFALLEVTPRTGRTHQIRVHLAAIGHPIVGDTLYRRPRINADSTPKNFVSGQAQMRAEIKISRQFLHSAYLKFTAPSGAPLALEAELPEDLSRVLDMLPR